MRMTTILGLLIGLQITAFNQTESAPAPFGKYTESMNDVTLELVRIPTGSFLIRLRNSKSQFLGKRQHHSWKYEC